MTDAPATATAASPSTASSVYDPPLSPPNMCTLPSSQRHNPSNPWGIVAAASPAALESAPGASAAPPAPPAAASLADIMAQQESERLSSGAANARILAAEQADLRLAERLSIEAEPAEVETNEERMLRMALAESLAYQKSEVEVAAASVFSVPPRGETSPPSASAAGVRKKVGFDPVIGGDAATGDGAGIVLDPDEQMRLAIELSLRESHGMGKTPPTAGAGPKAEEDDDDDGGGKKRAASPSKSSLTDNCAKPSPSMAKDGGVCDDGDAKIAAVPPPDKYLAAAAVAATASCSASGTLPPDPHLSEDEALQIERALREADDAEAAASLSLAMRLQGEEERRRIGEAVGTERGRLKGNVRTATRADFLYQRGDGAALHGGGEIEGGARAREGSVERKLWGADDYELHQEHFAQRSSAVASDSGLSADEDRNGDSDSRGDGPSSASSEGFRMNSSNPSKSWTRLDRNTIVSADGEVRTKHDVRLKNVSNAERLLAMDADDDGLGVGGISGVSDRAYNSLRQTVKNRGTVKGVAAHGTGRAEDYGGSRTREGGMDQSVRLVVSRAINRGLVNACNGIVKEGKEAVLYHADAGRGAPDEDTGEMTGGSGGYDVAVKVFKRIQEFRARGAYVDGDPRYRGRSFADVDRREQVELWAEKEYRNLVRANRGGVPVPTPLHVKENVLFMRFLGDEGWPAPQLREVGIRKGSPRWEALYCVILLATRKLYHCARLVHGDLSEYNVLVCPARLVDNRAHGADLEDLQAALIDLGQAVDVCHPRADELLTRDLMMIRAFFVRQGIKPLEEEEALQFVRGKPSLLKGEESEVFDEEQQVEAETEDEKLGAGAHEESKQKAKKIIPDWDDAFDIEVLQRKLARIQSEVTTTTSVS
eukprot:CAMPEP_0113566124 /NCGR_PEP_ID=MMETSP0015_2-20120614/22555_1 /TAXON_ID=2838 /ORGANISM="Odontella" /LENGTH=882 /DNA_ID=CAMNT_0000468391 /DNA_START=39 /DNA_END=2688 /DNA_ORIENTATION=- /assembly_acc=CAM_ASM_000160